MVWDHATGQVRGGGEPAARPEGGSAPLRCLFEAESPAAAPRRVQAALERGGAAAALDLEAAGAWVAADLREGTLLAATDRLGLSPLYLAERGDLVAVGDRPLAVAEALGLDPRPDPAACAAHLLARPIPSGRSFFAGVAALPPATLLTLGPRRREEQVYWRPEAGPAIRSVEELTRRTVERLAELAALHAPGGAVSLSGGLDSASVAAAFAPRAALTAAVTWTAPELPAVDESAAAGRLAARLGIPLHTVRGDRLWPLSGGEALLASPSRPYRLALPELFDALFAAARRAGAGWLATGGGGDQLFRAGRFFAFPEMLLAGRWRSVARGMRGRLVRQLLRPLLVALLPRWRPGRGRPPGWLRPAAAAAAPPPAASFGWLPRPASRLRREHLAAEALRDPLLDLGELAAPHGLLLAHPLIDHRLIEIALAAAPEALFPAGEEKAPLRRLLARAVPGEAVGVHSGRPATALVHLGLRQRGTEVAHGLLADMRAADLGWIDPAALAESYRRYLEGEGDLGFWPALTLEAWLRRF